jgi:hypothetical protein
LYVLILKFGGYEEEELPDVGNRDKAQDICASEEVSNIKMVFLSILLRFCWWPGFAGKFIC